MHGSLKLNFALLQATSRPFLASQGTPTTGCQASERLRIEIDSSITDAPLASFFTGNKTGALSLFLTSNILEDCLGFSCCYLSFVVCNLDSYVTAVFLKYSTTQLGQQWSEQHSKPGSQSPRLLHSLFWAFLGLACTVFKTS